MIHYSDEREKDNNKQKEVKTAKRPINQNAKSAVWIINE